MAAAAAPLRRVWLCCLSSTTEIVLTCLQVRTRPKTATAIGILAVLGLLTAIIVPSVCLTVGCSPQKQVTRARVRTHAYKRRATCTINNTGRASCNSDVDDIYSDLYCQGGVLVCRHHQMTASPRMRPSASSCRSWMTQMCKRSFPKSCAISIR